MKILVLLSGGLDSATCLGIAINKAGKENVETLNIIYGQKHDKEIQAANELAKYYDVNYSLIDLSEILKYSNCSLLKHSTEEIKHKSYIEQRIEQNNSEPVSTYVPFRNGLMLSCAASFAISKKCAVIYYGIHADDQIGSAYPDCSETFNSAMNNAIYEGSGKKLTIEAPLLNMNKAQVVKTGLDLKVPYQLTTSCYEGKNKACGTCATCIDRINAFKQNNTKDLIEYEINIDW